MRVRALCCLGLVGGVLGLGASPAHAQQGRTMTLQSVSIDKQGRTLPPEFWTLAPRGEVIATFPFGRARFVFPLPDAVPAQGGPATMTLETTGTNYAPSMSIYGQAVKEGRVDLGNYARSETVTPVTLPPESRTATLDPANVPAGATTTTVSVGILDGPRYDYIYAVSAPPPTPTRTPTPTPPSPAITDSTITPSQAFGFPPTRRCVSRRNFKIRLKRQGTVRYLAAKVSVNGRQTPVFVSKRRYLTIRGPVLKRRVLGARVDLRGLPKGVFKVQITAVTKSLRTIRDTRTYRTCGLRRR